MATAQLALLTKEATEQTPSSFAGLQNTLLKVFFLQTNIHFHKNLQTGHAFLTRVSKNTVLLS